MAAIMPVMTCRVCRAIDCGWGTERRPVSLCRHRLDRAVAAGLPHLTRERHQVQDFYGWWDERAKAERRGYLVTCWILTFRGGIEVGRAPFKSPTSTPRQAARHEVDVAVFHSFSR